MLASTLYSSASTLYSLYAWLIGLLVLACGFAIKVKNITNTRKALTRGRTDHFSTIDKQPKVRNVLTCFHHVTVNFDL